MRASVMTGIRTLAIGERTPGPQQVLVEVVAVGVL